MDRVPDTPDQQIRTAVTRRIISTSGAAGPASASPSWSWAKEPWPQAFRDHADLREELEAEIRHHCGIRREFVFSHADRGPGGLFVLTMTCGFVLTTVRWPSQRKMLTANLPPLRLAEIIRRTPEHRAGEGWSAFRTDQHIHGLGPAFGTKLLYFAG